MTHYYSDCFPSKYSYYYRCLSMHFLRNHINAAALLGYDDAQELAKLDLRYSREDVIDYLETLPQPDQEKIIEKSESKDLPRFIDNED